MRRGLINRTPSKVELTPLAARMQWHSALGHAPGRAFFAQENRLALLLTNLQSRIAGVIIRINGAETGFSSHTDARKHAPNQSARPGPDRLDSRKRAGRGCRQCRGPNLFHERGLAPSCLPGPSAQPYQKAPLSTSSFSTTSCGQAFALTL